MAGFFDKVKESLDKGVTAASVRSKEMLETQQVKSKLGGFQDQKRSALEVLGKEVYDMMAVGGLDPEPLRARVEEITSLDQQIAEKEQELEQIRVRAEEALKGGGAAASAAAPAAGTKFCPSCGGQVAGGAKFCPGCGSKVE